LDLGRGAVRLDMFPQAVLAVLAGCADNRCAFPARRRWVTEIGQP
jgi:hypothetical protein